MTQYDDTQIGQFTLEALPKLIFHLDFIKKNPDIKIHYGFNKQLIMDKWVYNIFSINCLTFIMTAHRL